MEQSKNKDLGVPASEQAVGLSATISPKTERISATIPHALMDEVLRIIIGDYERKSWMAEPFSVENWSAATDAHLLVGFQGPSEYPACRGYGTTSERINAWLSGKNAPNTSMLVPKSGLLSGSEVVEALSKWPRTNEKDCDRCGGDGIEQSDDTDYDGEFMVSDCQCCGGSGVVHAQPDEEQFLDPMHAVEVLGIARFKHFTWEKLAKVVSLLGIRDMRITHGSPNTMMRLEPVGFPMVICVMPAAHYEGCEEPFYVHRDRAEAEIPQRGTSEELQPKTDGDEGAGSPKPKS